jgi:hypothetical protein
MLHTARKVKLTIYRKKRQSFFEVSIINRSYAEIG